jgi:hypothetical protein
MRYAHLSERQFLKKSFLVKSGHFWSRVLVKLPTKVYSKLFFSYQVLKDASNKHKHFIFGLQLLKKSPFALNFLNSCRTKIVFNECPQIFSAIKTFGWTSWIICWTSSWSSTVVVQLVFSWSPSKKYLLCMPLHLRCHVARSWILR